MDSNTLVKPKSRINSKIAPRKRVREPENSQQEAEYLTARKATRPVKLSKYILPIALLLGLFVSAIGATNSWKETQRFQILPLKPEMAIYYESLGDVCIETGKLRLVSTIKRAEVESDIKLIQEVVNNVTKLYDYYDLEEILLEKLEDEAKEAVQYLSYLKQWQPSYRKKRYVFGKILQFIFGVNEEVYEDINDLAKHEDILKENQQKIHQVLIQSLKKENENNQKLANQSLELAAKVDHSLGDLEFGEKKIHDELHMLLYHTQASFIIKQIFKKYKDIVEPSINYGLLDIQKNLTELKVTKNTRLSRYALPSQFTSILEHGLYNKNTFKLYKITPIPHIVNKSIYIPQLEGSFVAVRMESQEYFLLSDSEFKSCTEEEESTYVCTPKMIFNLSMPNCALIGIVQNSQNDCTYSILMPYKLIFKQLLTQNAWIFTAPRNATVQIICIEIRQKITIEGTGILQIGKNCHLQVNNTKILGNDIQEIKIINSFTQLHMANPANYSFQLKPLQMDIRLLKHDEEFDAQPLEPFHLHSHWSLWWILAFMGTSLVVLKAVTFIKCNKTGKYKTATHDAAVQLEKVKPIKLNYKFQKVIHVKRRKSI